LPVKCPSWLPDYIPELQGLRGIAILLVLFYHCHPRLEHTRLIRASLWGWVGVNLFFVLSGFLITSILLETRGKPHYFRNFYGRRALRIWPVYVLVLAVCALQPGWFLNQGLTAFKHAGAWVACALLVQNLLHLTLPSAIGPTWSLAIEEQYYFVWAPAVRVLGRPWVLAGVLIVVLTASPILRLSHFSWLTPTHTLIHLDGIALGSLIAVGLYSLAWSRRVWMATGLTGFVTGLLATAFLAEGTAFLDSALALCFGGAVLAAIASTTGVPGDRSSSPGWSTTGVPGDRSSSRGWSTGARNPLSAALRRGPLAFYGRISYGLYMTHIMVFIYLGLFDLRMDAYGTAGDLAVVAVRFAATTLIATALWYGFESQILKLKRFLGPGKGKAGSE
jgi:peptidoglycan/LPS O-acetylase OafA/YrhL